MHAGRADGTGRWMRWLHGPAETDWELLRVCLVRAGGCCAHVPRQGSHVLNSCGLGACIRVVKRVDWSLEDYKTPR